MVDALTAPDLTPIGTAHTCHIRQGHEKDLCKIEYRLQMVRHGSPP